MTHQVTNSHHDWRGNSPEWSIQAARELGGIAHERAPIPIATVNEFPLYSQDPSVHHVARSNTVRAGSGVGKGNFGNTVD